MRRLYVDTTVLTFALGGEHEFQSPCREIVAGAAAGRFELHASVEAVQEFLFHRLRRGDREEAVTQASDVRSMIRLHAFDSQVLDRSIALVAATAIRGRDAVHAATALGAGFTEIVSTDSDFDDVPGLTRVDPADVVLDQS